MSVENINYLQLLQECEELLGVQPEGFVFSCIDNLSTVIDIVSQINSGLVRNAVSKLITAKSILENGSWNASLSRRRVTEISEQSLRFLLSLNISVTKMALMFGVSKMTVHRRLKQFGMSVTQTFTSLSNTELDLIVQQIVREHPNTGSKRLAGFLKARDVKVAKRRREESLRRVDPSGVEHRRSCNRAIYRRQYYVQYSMEIWHIDTHHKLIRWGFVVRGGIDGKSRTIVYLDAGCDNTSASNLESFMTGVRQYGIPLRTRSDKGGENYDVAFYMLHSRGTGRGSHLCGRSVHNQRIERLWRDVHYGCLSVYKQTFIRLEEIGYVDTNVPKTVAVLQYVYLPRINQCLEEFRTAWNHHPMSSEHNQTPTQLLFLNLPPSDRDLFATPAPVSLPESESDDLAFNNPMVMENFRSLLTDDDITILETFDVLAESNSFGADIYMNIMNTLNGRP